MVKEGCRGVSGKSAERFQVSNTEHFRSKPSYKVMALQVCENAVKAVENCSWAHAPNHLK